MKGKKYILIAIIVFLCSCPTVCAISVQFERWSYADYSHLKTEVEVLSYFEDRLTATLETPSRDETENFMRSLGIQGCVSYEYMWVEKHSALECRVLAPNWTWTGPGLGILIGLNEFVTNLFTYEFYRIIFTFDDDILTEIKVWSWGSLPGGMF